MEEKGLFEHYEMRNWEITSRIYKILGASAIINFLILFAFGQFNLLNTRGCDTPYIGVVCQVLDSAYIASTFLGKGTEFESITYKKTEIGNEEEVTFIDVSHQLKYPDGYFALANPEQMLENPTDELTGLTPGDTSSPSNTTEDLSNKVQVLPTPNDKVADQKVPDEIFTVGKEPSSTKNPSVAKRTPKPGKNDPMSNKSPDKLPGDETTAKTTPKPTPEPTPTDPQLQTAKDEFAQRFNKKPLQDFADGVIAKVDSNKPEEKIDLKQSFTVVLDGVITPDGKFDAKKTRFIKGEGDQKMIDVAKSALEAIGDSTLFGYLNELNKDSKIPTKVNITLVQNDKEIFAIIRSEQPTEQRAKTVSSGFNGLVLVANMNTKDDKDIQTLLKAVKVKAEGKSVVINFTMPKEDAHKLIDQKLQEARQKKSQTNNNDEQANSKTAPGK